jgi:phospholipase C
MTTGNARVSLALAAGFALTALGGGALAAPHGAARAASPITHIVVVFQENHSFDNVFGRFCSATRRCDGATTGLLHDGSIIELPHAGDVVASVAHSPGAQQTAIDGGAMDGFDEFRNCRKANGYQCFGQYDPSDIPNLTALASSFAISDATFETTPSGSWTSHLQLVASTIDGFEGSNPVDSTYGVTRRPGWGCDSFTDARWVPPSGRDAIFVPSCVPDENGNGPYRASPVSWVPTIMDRLDGAGVSWKLYSGMGPEKRRFGAGYLWEICPTFAECLDGPQATNWVASHDILKDAERGRLPSVSLVTPTDPLSQHNSDSMAKGDNWLGELAGAIEDGPDWSSTALFITYDDCGCFYDHVPPPAGAGIRVPMVIVSPHVRPHFTDSQPATFDSVLAFIEHTFGLAPLAAGDAAAYDYSGAFDFAGAPLPRVRTVITRIPAWEERYLASHPGDPNDPT